MKTHRVILMLLLVSLLAMSHAAATLTVPTLRDAGGLPAPAAGEPSLILSLTNGLRATLAEMSYGRVMVAAVRPRGNATSWTLEGDISCVSRGSDAKEYLCVVRLFQEGSPRILRGQWAGHAESLRFLTGNLGMPGVHILGLFGEFSQSVLKVLDAAAELEDVQRLTALCTQVASTADTAVTFSRGETSLAQEDGLPVVCSGAVCQLVVQSRDSLGYGFIIPGWTDARWLTLRALDGQGTLAYGVASLTFPVVTRPTKLDVWVLLRTQKQSTAVSVLAATLPEALLTTDAPVALTPTTDATPSTPHSLAALACAILERDPPGSWVAQRVTVLVKP